jgi:ABC-type glutathione transport system ATPase component
MNEVHPILEVEALVKCYASRRGAGHSGRANAVDGVSLSIAPATTLALVGESGSGKSTLAFCVACLEKPTSGRIWWNGLEVSLLTENHLRPNRSRVQMIFQDPASAMNPRWTASQIVAEPLVIQNQLTRRDQFEHAQLLLERVGLPASAGARRLAEFSGGQRQRIAIARALALGSKLLILDEALSALDCSVQAQIANLLLDLQESSGISLLFITHDLVMAAHLADQVAVMDRGRIVEAGTADEVIRHPEHEQTRMLLAATSGLGRVTPESRDA